jgi:hypothetical protein
MVKAQKTRPYFVPQNTEHCTYLIGKAAGLRMKCEHMHQPE